MNKIVVFGLLFIILTVFSCESPQNDTKEATPPREILVNSFAIPYDLANPAKSLRLSSNLKEISGLALSSDGNFILANNDEEGKVFYLDKESGEIKKDYLFNEDGDYEGIEMVGNSIYVVKNNGTIYEFEEGVELNSTKHKTALSSENDVEGLGYDADKNALILACKGKRFGGKEYKGSKTFHLFDLNTKKLMEVPYFALSDADLVAHYNKYSTDSRMVHRMRLERIKSFSPSGIAKHPITKDWYMLSSVGKMLIVTSEVGTLKEVRFLSRDKHLQPEGICFEKNGDLYISNEAKDYKAKLFKYEYVSK